MKKRTKRTFLLLLSLTLAVTCILPVQEASATDQRQDSAQAQDTVQAQAQTPSQTQTPAEEETVPDGWQKIDGDTYYYKNGKAVTGVRKIDGVWYRFTSIKGRLKFRIGDNMDKKAQKFRSRTKWLMLVSLKKHQVRIYKGKKNKWIRKKKFKCTTGKSSTPTLRGEFTVGIKGRYFNTGYNGRCWYYTQFSGNYLFHSVIYDRSSRPVHVLDGRLGRSLSHGCVRLSLKNAKWIYKYIPRRTKVYIY